MPTTETQEAELEFNLAENVSDYLDALANGLSADFPGEFFDELKLLGRLGVVARLYDQAVKHYLASFSLMPVELQVLVTLKAKVAFSPADLATATQQTRAGMTSTLDRLEKRKLIKRIPHEKDRRKTLIQLTTDGESFTNKLVRTQNQALQQMMKNVSGDELANMNDTLNQIIDLMS
ncbi:MAG: MarR family transcriptional regulator [Pseudomonadales bacterium]|nr:MarR family transcriptional regulator [Pseudomonadales bacterium]